MQSINLVCWNVNGIRSIIKKDFLKDVKTMDPDILCLQETKAGVEEVKSALELMPAYKGYINSSKARQGYSGTAILSKHEPFPYPTIWPSKIMIGREEWSRQNLIISSW
jgi:exodeoxyribonuclease-3